MGKCHRDESANGQIYSRSGLASLFRVHAISSLHLGICREVLHKGEKIITVDNGYWDYHLVTKIIYCDYFTPQFSAWALATKRLVTFSRLSDI